MSQLFLIRRQYGETGVVGDLYLDGSKICNTLENLSKLIPVGEYRINVSLSPTFTKKRKEDTFLPLLTSESVKASRGIRIHAGNVPSDSSGCVLVGIQAGDAIRLQLGSRRYENFVTELCSIVSIKTLTICDAVKP